MFGVASATGGAAGSGGMTVDAGGVTVAVPESAAAGSALDAPIEAVSAALLSATQAMRNRVVGLVDRGVSLGSSACAYRVS
ncbi:hypothetical protein GCM10023194_43660 [Planotetraspora phitsanulokensis]|uniref:Uncharacterized protein n=1 Tax=Planotetraspora phitsanulokensis TaxID=575192 RepID=A0A8J3XIV4_9ACTN|nr:hypothetical protein Pph01_29710 [Planotetraspora phitsanulokensis]